METFRGSPFKNLPEKRVLTISHRLPCEVRTEFDSGTKCLQSSHSFLILPPVQPPKWTDFIPVNISRQFDACVTIDLTFLCRISIISSHSPALSPTQPSICNVVRQRPNQPLVIPSRASVSSIGTLRLSNMWIIGASARICAMRRDRPLCQSRI